MIMMILFYILDYSCTDIAARESYVIRYMYIYELTFVH